MTVFVILACSSTDQSDVWLMSAHITREAAEKRVDVLKKKKGRYRQLYRIESAPLEHE